MSFKILKVGKHTSSKMQGKSWILAERLVETPLGNTYQTGIRSFDSEGFKATLGQVVDHAATEGLFEWK